MDQASCVVLAVSLAIILICPGVLGHGFITKPAARNWLAYLNEKYDWPDGLNGGGESQQKYRKLADQWQDARSGKGRLICEWLYTLVTSRQCQQPPLQIAVHAATHPSKCQTTLTRVGPSLCRT